MITQKEIAKRLGVSQALVSRVLAGTADRIGVATGTARRIREAAARLDYRPSAAAQSLRGGPSRTLGVLVRDFGDPFFGQMIAELSQVAHLAHYSIVLASYDPASGETADVASLMRYRVERLVLCGSHFPSGLIHQFMRGGARVVQIGVGSVPPGAGQVSADEEFGLGRLVSYLKQLGHRDLGYLGGSMAANRRRQEVVRRCALGEGLSVHPGAWVTVRGSTADAGYQAVVSLLEKRRRRLPTALVAADDMMALGALRALHEKGMRVPHDVSLAGFDDVPFAGLSVPALTTVRQPIRDMVRVACGMLDDMPVAGEDAVRLVRPELIIRESCAAPRRRSSP